MRPRVSRAEAWLLGVFVLLGLGYSVLVPMWEAPDETNHYLVALHLARRGTLPPAGYNAETHQPPAWYWLAGAVLWPLDRIDPDLTSNHRPAGPYAFRRPPRFAWNEANYRFLWGPQILRWLGVATGALALHWIAVGVRQLTPGSETLGLAAAALAGLTPQFVHISASISNDPASYLAGALLFRLAMGLCAGEPSAGPSTRSAASIPPVRLAAAAAAALALPLLVKLSVLPVSVLLLVVVGWRALQRPGGAALRAALLAAVVAVLLVVLLVPELLGSEIAAQLWTRATHVRADAFDHLPAVTRRFLLSYWGLAGWMATPLPSLVVRALCGLAGVGLVAAFAHQVLAAAPLRERAAGPRIAVLVAALACVMLGPWPAALAAPLGLLLLVRRRAPDGGGAAAELSPLAPVPARAPVWRFAWLGLALALVVFFKNFLSESFGVQGRFLFPASGFVALLVVAGWLTVLPTRLHAALPWAVGVLLVAANLVLWTTGIVPTYYQPFLG